MPNLTPREVETRAGVISYLEAGAGEPLLYLHGAGGRPPRGATFVSRLAGSHRILVPSRPGFDESPSKGNEHVKGAAEAMAAFLEATADGPAHVVAQSAGAAVGMWLAVLHPHLVTSLVLSAPAAFARRHGTGTPRSPQELERLLYGNSPSWSGPPDDEERARIRRNAAFNQEHFGGSNEDLLERLASIQAPVMVLWGTEDALVTPDDSGVYQKHISQALRVFIYGAAHELPIAATDPWVRLIKDFLLRGEFFVVNREDDRQSSGEIASA